MTNLFITSVLSNKTKTLINRLQDKEPEFLKIFYLSGGTALALQIGHRESEDMDFFSERNFDPRLVETELKRFGELADTELGENTLNTTLGEVKLQYLGYPYRLIEPLIDWEGIQVSSVGDIAATKLQTISMRGSKKDFVDLYFILKKYSLRDLFQLLEKKYSGADYNQVHILKSLTYFEDAEGQPMPRMHKEVEWEEVKKKITAKVKGYSLENN